MKIKKEPIQLRESPKQFDEVQSPDMMESLIEADNLVRATEARNKFRVTGRGITVAVLDTGVRATHVDFAGRIKAQRNFTHDNGGDPLDANDGQGHGTNVTGIIAAGAVHIGIAPEVEIVALKVLDNQGRGDFSLVDQALQWVLDNNHELNISVICMSLGDEQNHMSDYYFSFDTTASLIRTLISQGVAIVVAAGNEYYSYNSQQGMAYPAILRDCISVGAVYDAFEGGFSYRSGAEVIESGPDRITPFSQRLHSSLNPDSFTTVFGPGAPIVSTGINNDYGESVQHGTSQAAPVIAGIVALVHEQFLNLTGQLPPVEYIKDILRRGAVDVIDGDDELDNVIHTQLTFRRASALGALKSINAMITKELFAQGVNLKDIKL